MAIVATLLLTSLGGCGLGSSGTEESPRLASLELNTAPPPESEGEEWPEVLSQVGGENDDYLWGHGLGYVQAPVRDVWQAVQDPLLVADRRGTDSQEFVIDEDPRLDHGFTLFYAVERLITIEWSEEWCHAVTEGSLQEPVAAVVRYQKVEGDDVIELIEGSITLLEVAPSVTEVGFVEHLQALGAEPTMISQYFDDLFDSILAGAAGEPLPEY